MAETLVLEAGQSTGGAATTESPWRDTPELRVTRLSYAMSLLPPTAGLVVAVDALAVTRS